MTSTVGSCTTEEWLGREVLELDKSCSALVNCVPRAHYLITPDISISSKASIGKLQPAGHICPLPAFANKVLAMPTHLHFVVHCFSATVAVEYLSRCPMAHKA